MPMQIFGGINITRTGLGQWVVQPAFITAIPSQEDREEIAKKLRDVADALVKGDWSHDD